MLNRPKACANCGYELVGMGSRGSCPECGTYWNALTGENIEAGGAERRRRVGKAVDRIRTVVLVVAAGVMLVCGGLLSWAAHAAGGNVLRPVVIAGIIAGLLVLAAVTSFVYEDDAG
jgi:predicted ATP-dependent serine protease